MEAEWLEKYGEEEEQLVIQIMGILLLKLFPHTQLFLSF